MLFLLPEIILFSTSVLVLVYDLIAGSEKHKNLVHISLGGLLLSLVAIFAPALSHGTPNLFYSGEPLAFFSNFYWVDVFSVVYKSLFLVIGILTILINFDFFENAVKKNAGEFYFLFLSAILGLILMVSSPNLLLIYLGMETVGFASYLLVGWQKQVARSNEAALKYFLFGAVASAIFLYGISIFYGFSGSFDLSLVPDDILASPLYLIAIAFMIFGFGFKIAMAPMQFWCPDVYEGAPTPITAFLSVGPKAAGFAALLRLLVFIKIDLLFLFAVVSALTMTWGNLLALRQTNIKRLLAFSSIAQAGYILIGLVSPRLGYPIVAYYLFAYTFANLGIFAIITYLSLLLKSENVDSFGGFARRSPWLAAALAIFLFSLIGIPPLSGFVGKFLVFRAAISNGFLWLALLGALNSVVSVYYYLDLLRHMYFSAGETSPVNPPRFIKIVVWICLVATILLGVFPHWLI